MSTKSKQQDDAKVMDFEEWCEIWGDELWAEWHEIGGNMELDNEYDEWCEKKFNKYNES